MSLLSSTAMNTARPLTLCAALLFTACSQSETQAGESAAPQVLSVFTVNYPLRYFAERIGGELVDVTFPAPAGEDPAFWKPDTETVSRYQAADLILLNGAGYADWTRAASLPMATTVDTSAGFADRYIVESGVTHTHGPEGEHSHGTTAFTTWLDPTLAIEQAGAIRDALVRHLPDQEQALQERYRALERELFALDTDLGFVVTEPQRPLLGSHPVYQYLRRKYELDLQSLHWEPDQVPSEQEWDQLQALLAEHPAGAMIWEAAPLGEVQSRLQSLGVESLVFAPCGNTPQVGDYLAVQRENVQNLRLALR